MELPKDGWRYVSTTDLKSVSGCCGLCGTPIRYVHRIEHIEADLVLDIGCECASNVMNGEDLSYIRDKDREIKNAANREKAEQERLRRQFEERNKFNLAHGIQPISWKGFLMLMEATKKKNEEYAAKKAAQKRRK